MAKLTIDAFEDGTLRYDVTQYNYRLRIHRLMDAATFTYSQVTLEVTSGIYGLLIHASFDGIGWRFAVTRMANRLQPQWRVISTGNQLVIMLPADYHVAVN